MAQNLKIDNAAQRLNPLLQALRLEDQSSRQKGFAEILHECDADGAVSLISDALWKSSDSDSRQVLVEELAKLGSAKAVELLETVMTDNYFDPGVQRKAAEALGQVPSEEAAEALLLFLEDANGWGPVRAEAVRSLGHFDSDKAVEGLIEASKDIYLGFFAVRSLGQMGSDRAADGLATVIRGLLSGAYGEDFLHGPGVTVSEAMAGLVRLSPEKSVDLLIEARNAPDSICGYRLLYHLSQSKPRQLIALLRERLQDKALPSRDRKTAAEMLGIVGTHDEVPFLKSMWRADDDTDVGWHSLGAAEQIALSEFTKQRAFEETRAFIAHEFRHCLTPLNAYVKMLDEALTQPQDDKEKLLSLTARIRQQTDAAIELVERYLDYSRPLAPHFAQIDVSDLLQQSLTEFGADLEKRRIVLQCRLAEDSDAEVDRQMVAQVLRNLIANAIQAMGQDGELTITSALREEDVAVTVRDSGAGLKPEHLAHVFEIGFTTKSNVRGAGLGLALCKRIIEEAHHGTVAIANNTDGPGATVVITLPKKQLEIHNGRHHLALADR